MGIQFFTNWELWEQLTFVLAAGIVAVFFIGWAKLWWMQRLLKKYALLDEEKKARQTELRRSGLPAGRKVDIPFGVRAIQSGVEVDGIWISRPGTPMEVRSSSQVSATTLNLDGDSRPEDKGKAIAGGGILRTTAIVTEIEPTPKPSPRLSATGGYFGQSIRQDIGGTPSSGSQTAYLQPYSILRPTIGSDPSGRYSPVIHQSESAADRHHVESYVPTPLSSTAHSSPSSQARPVVDRVSISSDEGLAFLSPVHQADARSRPSGYSSHYMSPYEESDSSSSAGPSRTQGKYCSRVRAETRGSPLQSPEIGSAPSPEIQPLSRTSLASTRPMPVRTYTDQRGSTSPRVVNAGFEVLPVGTFGRPSGDGWPLNDQAR
ncbi:hypothetical protein F4777DRAFT_250481 [Nemania sp. FL0916]|nr:hypothetical protein F4777DRAFT_250481 [Nemania sp. FL0916]